VFDPHRTTGFQRDKRAGSDVTQESR